MKNIYQFILCLALTASTGLCLAQQKIYTEAEIAVEGQFIDGVQAQLLGQYEKAIEIFEKMWKEDDSQAMIAFELSRCYRSVDDHAKAIHYAKKAFEIDESNEFYVMRLAEAYEADQKNYLAAETYENYTKVNKKDRYFYEKATQLYMQDGNYKQAVQVLDEMEKNFGVEEIVSRQKFEIYSKLGDDKKAVAELENLMKAYPDDDRYVLNLASYYLQTNEIKKAEKIYKELLKKDPENETALRFLRVGSAAKNSALIYLQSLEAEMLNMDISLDEKLVKLMPVLQQLTSEEDPVLATELVRISEVLSRTYPMDAKAQAVYGDAMILNNQYQDAIAAYERTLELDGSVFEVWSQLMEAQKMTSQFDALLKTSDDAMMRFPNQALVYLYHGFALTMLERPQDAVEILQEGSFMTGKNPSLKADILAEQVHAYVVMESLADAEKTLLKIKEIGPLTAYAWEMTGELALAQGNKSNAIEVWKEALKLFPNHPGLLNRISMTENMKQ